MRSINAVLVVVAVMVMMTITTAGNGRIEYGVDTTYMRGSGVEVPITGWYTEAPLQDMAFTWDAKMKDVAILASILQAECQNISGDWRREATIIANRLDLPIGHPKNPNGTLRGVIEVQTKSGRYAQFNGASSEIYTLGLYEEKAWWAAYEVLIDGYRAFNGDPAYIYFTNVEYVKQSGGDLAFVNSVHWTHVQKKLYAHSYGVQR